MLGKLLNGRYRLDTILGQGGMGTVYRAHDTLLDRPVAVKILNASGLGSAVRERLLHEAQAAARLNHPNIVSVHDAGEADEVPYIVMEFVAGESLHHRPPTDLTAILEIAQQVCAALEHAHRHGIIHRDLKPENILITPAGTAKLMDFGLARSGISRLTGEGSIAGTVFYLAPELVLGQQVDGRADLYALGVILYELSTGHLPFMGDDPLTVIAQHVHQQPQPPRQVRPDLPPALETILLKLLAKQPGDRFASAHELGLALLESVKAEGQTASGLPPNNLPVQLSSFIGREQEIREIKHLLEHSRLVTLTGAGGTGKTRLALQVAAGLLHTFPDGVWLIELAPLSDPMLIPHLVASTLGLREQPGRPIIETISDFLRSRQLLLLLDNCEHLIEACARFAEALLRACPNLRILATSREAINITGERAWNVPTLSVPDLRQISQTAANSAPIQGGRADHGLASTLTRYEAIQLFVDRAQAVHPAFTLTDQNAWTVAQICYRLDGIPLAIELAAARLKALALEQVAARLDDRFSLLTVGSRTALPRHQTLRATIDWSHDLLTPAEQTLFRRLSVFSGGWTIEAAEAVCGDEGSGMELDLLAHLVDKSLVIMEEHGGETRYHLLETIRQYARVKLSESGEAASIHQRHLEFFVALANQAAPELRRAAQLEWLARLEVEHDNLRAALEFSLENDETLAALTIAGSLYRFWYLHGYWREGRDWIERALHSPVPEAHDPRAVMLARASALYGLGWLADESGSEAEPYRQGLELSRAASDAWGIALGLRATGVLAYNQNDSPQAQVLLDESLALFRDIGDPWGQALTLFNQGWVSFGQDQPQQAEELWEASLALFRQTGDRWGAAVALGALGYLARLRSDYKYAAAASKESLKLFRELGDKAGMADSLSRLGNVAVRRDDYKQAEALFEEGLVLQREMGYRSNTAFSLCNLGVVAGYQGDFTRARELIEEGQRIWHEIGYGWGIALSNDLLALMAFYQGDLQAATTLWQTSRAAFQEIDEKAGVASALNGLGRISQQQGDPGRAQALLDESLALYREVGDKFQIAQSLASHARLALQQGDFDRASSLFKESLVLRKELGAKRGIAEALEGLAATALAQADPRRAAWLLGAAESLRQSLGAPLPPVERLAYDQDLDALRASLPPDEFETTWQAGSAARLEQIAEVAMQEGA